MKNTQKGIANIILIVIVVILAGALGYVTLVKKSAPVEQQPGVAQNAQPTKNTTITQTSPATQTQLGEIVGWKTYINNRYGFEVKYPESYFEFHKSGDSSVSFRSTEGCKSLLMGGGEWPADCQDYSISTQKNKLIVEGTNIIKTSVMVAGVQAEKVATFGGMWNNMAQVVVQFQKDQDWYIQTFTFNQEKSQVAEEEMNRILSTFKFVASSQSSSLPVTCVDKPDGVPVITSILPVSGPAGTKVEIRGCNLSGFEGDRDVVFVRNDGAEIPLYGGTINPSFSEEENKGKLVKITLQSYCVSGSVEHRYSGITSSCKTVEAMPGNYKVYVTAWGKKSNEAAFTIK